MRRDDEDDRAGGSWIDHVVVPDDLSALDAEVRALRRERRAKARRERWRRLLGPRGVSGPLVIVVLLMVAGVASLTVLFQPRRPTTPPAPLATSGRNDGLLPDLPVTLPDGSSRPLRSFRPAVLALAPVGCGCDRSLAEIGTATVEHGVQFALVDRRVPPQPAGLAADGTVRLAEPTGALAGTYKAEVGGRRAAGGPVLVLVGPDGQVARVLAEPIPTANFGRELDALRIGAGTPAPTG